MVDRSMTRAVEKVQGQRVRTAPAHALWHGRPVNIVDGTSVSMPDTDDNQKTAHPVFAYFGVARYRMTGDAVPGPLAFFALRQQHEDRTADSLHRVIGRAKPR